MLPQDSKTVCYRRWGGRVVLVCIGLYVTFGAALAIETARELVRRDGTLLQQAHACLASVENLVERMSTSCGKVPANCG